MKDLQCDTDLRNACQNVRLCLPAAKIPVLSYHEWQMASLLGSMYVCEQYFSNVKVVKSKSEIDSRMRNWKTTSELLLLHMSKYWENWWRRNSSKLLANVSASFKI